jgi:hypothetical protein
MVGGAGVGVSAGEGGGVALAWTTGAGVLEGVEPGVDVRVAGAAVGVWLGGAGVGVSVSVIAGEGKDVGA